MKECIICKVHLDKGKSKFCSNLCYNENRRNIRVRVKEPIDFNCEYCGSIFTQRRKDNISCSEKCSQKLWIKNNPDKNFNRYNSDSYKHKKDKWNENNKEILKKIKNKYKLNKYHTDIEYRLKLNIGSMIRESFRNKNISKNKKSEEILGINIDYFKLYLESKFEDWMTWENRGLYNGELNYGWDIDHIIPISSAKTEEEIIKLNHYSNLQPLCSKINRDIKKDKINFLQC